MAQKLLFPVDFSPYTYKILGCAGELARVGLDEAVLLYVIKAKDYVDYGEEDNPSYVAEKQEAEHLLAGLADSLEDLGLKVNAKLISGVPAEVIVEAAEEKDVDLIFMGAHGKGFLDRITIGSVSEKVLKNADRSVLIQHCREIKDDGGYSCENVCSSLFGNVLVASDFTEYSRKVEPLLEDLSKNFCAPTTLLHVMEEKTDGVWEELEEARAEEAKARMEELERQSNELVGSCRSIGSVMIKGSPAEAILGYAKDVDASLIVVGAFGGRGIIKGMLGSVAEKVVRGSDRPVLVLKA